jgi:hypothetical protein
MKYCQALAGVALAMLLWATAAVALEQPKGDVILTVKGQISETNSASGAAFDMQMLSALPQTRFETTTRWTEKATFEGVLLKDLLAAVGAKGNEIVATALNDFSTTIPIKDISEVPVLIAARVNGQLMKIRDRGPLWVVYDVDKRPDLQNIQTERKMVWQLKDLIIR